MAIVKQCVDILLVEDNLGDVRLTIEAFKEANLPHVLHIANDGNDAMDFLHQRGAHCNAPRPGLILLDLNLPKKGGRELLSDIKADEDLRSVPVVILTTSEREKDIVDAYNRHANCYLTKPFDLDQFIDLVRIIDKFWLRWVQLPIKSG